MHLLDRSGALITAQTASSDVTIPGESPPESLTDILDLQTPTVTIEFGSYADGRGFSLARYLRGHLGYKGRLLAAGPLIPDQVRLLFQCGFDGLLLPQEQPDDSLTAESDPAVPPVVRGATASAITGISTQVTTRTQDFVAAARDPIVTQRYQHT